MKKQLILASASPRRRELLETAGYEFSVVTSHVEEITGGMNGREVARSNALAKARDVYSKNRSSVVVGADTVVCLGDDIMGKPVNRQDAANMLLRLSGTVHSVVTGYAVVSDKGEVSDYCETFVRFRDLSEAEINAYVATGESDDKAGAYGIQERASLFVEHIDGDYFNVMGLPVASIYPLLKDADILPRWQKLLL